MNIAFSLNDGSPVRVSDQHPWCELYRNSAVKLHTLTEDFTEADLVVFTESYNATSHEWNDFKSTATYKKFKSKAIVYNDRDVPYPVYPGLYTSIRKHLFRDCYYRSVPYLKVFTEVEFQNTRKDHRNYLYSFIGSRSHQLRNHLFNMVHDSDTYVHDSSQLNPYDVYNNENHWSQVRMAQANMVTVFNNSTYVLCPPGGSPNSFRIYEAMSCGAVPVIISDDLVLPNEINWETCSLRIRERDIDQLDCILRTDRDLAKLQSAVKDVFARFLCKSEKFNYLVRCMEGLKDTGVFALSRTHLTRVVIDRLINSVRYRIATKGIHFIG